MKFELTPLTSFMQFTQEDAEEALKVFNRSLDTVGEDIEGFRTWIKTQEHLRLMPNDRQIFTFLFLNKFHIERAKEKMDMFYSIRSLMPELFFDRLPSSKQMIKMNEMCCVLPLPKLTANKNRIIAHKIFNNKEPTFSSLSMFSYILLCTELRTLYELCISEEYILDFDNYTAGMLSKLTAMDIKKFFTVIDRVYSNRIAALHFINLPSYAIPFINLIKTFAKEKIGKRIHVHKNVESILELYPKELLPEDFGGNLRSLKEMNDDWMKLLLENEDYFETLQNVKVDESLRKKPLENDDILGFHGNFRKLTVD